jgi:hypothetical protein
MRHPTYDVVIVVHERRNGLCGGAGATRSQIELRDPLGIQ